MDNVKRDKKIVHAGDTCFRMHEFKEISNMAMEKVQGFFNFA
ncbi:hypothetical protein JCM16816_06830 [Thermoanaerobacter brockii subsp. lactiethylicus]|jgi:hypothetical protein